MPESRAQLRLAYAVKAGKSSAMPGSVAEEMIAKMHGRKMSALPERKHAKLRAMLARRKRRP